MTSAGKITLKDSELLLENIVKCLENGAYKIAQIRTHFSNCVKIGSPLELGCHRLDNLSTYYVNKRECTNLSSEGTWIYKDIVLSNPMPKPKSRWWNLWNDYVSERKEILPVAYVEAEIDDRLSIFVYGSCHLEELKNLLSTIKEYKLRIYLYKEDEVRIEF